MSKRGSARRPYRREEAEAAALRFEWVSLPAGDVCVREMRVAELVGLMELAARPKIDRRGGFDPGSSAVWQILYSCYMGEEPDAAPVWPHNQEGMREVMALSMETFTAIMKAIQRVNGMADSEVEVLTGFFPTSPELSSSA